jgi:hypothetical protein
MKLFAFLLLTSQFLFATDGYKVYQKHCQACHLQEPKKAWVLKNIDKMLAPPMIEVSSHLKENIIVKDGDEDIHRELVITFIKDYIQHPNIDKSFCRLGALDKFGVMPPIGKNLTIEERQAVAEWLFDFYEGKKFE